MNLNTLNDQQREAVLAERGPLLILAGAGSGKTRTLTARIAHLILEKKILPWKIMAITFTNKAAREMRQRLSSLLGETAEDLWIGTFHALSLRILRREGHRIGIPSTVMVYDSADQLTLLKECLDELDMDKEEFPPKAVRAVFRLSRAGSSALATMRRILTKSIMSSFDYMKRNFAIFARSILTIFSSGWSSSLNSMTRSERIMPLGLKKFWLTNIRIQILCNTIS